MSLSEYFSGTLGLHGMLGQANIAWLSFPYRGKRIARMEKLEKVPWGHHLKGRSSVPSTLAPLFPDLDQEPNLLDGAYRPTVRTTERSFPVLMRHSMVPAACDFVSGTNRSCSPAPSVTVHE